MYVSTLTVPSTTRPVANSASGTGASAIYTLLLLKTRPTCRMCATDVDSTSLASARVNIESNDLAPGAACFIRKRPTH